jgi:fatty acid hydroxylase family protein
MTAATPTGAGTPAEHGADVKTLAEARAHFAGKRSPWLIAAGILALAIFRVALGEPGWRDLIAVALAWTVYPFGEWAIHVYLLHMRPLRIGSRRIDPLAARAHRAHHRTPNDLSMILLDPLEVALLLLLAVPLTVAAGALIATVLAGPVPAGPLVSAALAEYVAIFLYEWSHFLIHTAYRPRSRYYRSIWRNHRLHHFKNERYWHGITQTVSDRVLGTLPDHREVRRSETARALHGGL